MVSIRSLLSKALVIALLSSVCSVELCAKKKVKIGERDIPEQSAGWSLKALFNSLDPLSVSQHLAFYELYAESKEGKEALRRAWKLLSGGTLPTQEMVTKLPHLDIQALISLVTRQSFDPPVKLNEEQFGIIAKIS